MEALTTALAGVPEWLQNFANEIFGYQAPQEGEASIGMVILLGVGIVFLGLICLVIVCSIFGLIGKATNRSKKKKEEIVPAAAKEEEIPDRQEFVAAVSAAIAEELGTDVSFGHTGKSRCQCFHIYLRL